MQRAVLKRRLLHSDECRVGRRQKRSVDDAVAQLLALGVLGFAFVPSTRAPLVGVAALLAIAVVVFVAFRRLGQRVLESDAGSSYGSASLQELRGAPAAPARSFTSASRNEDQHDLRNLDWYQFEKLIALLFEQTGCVVERKGGARADGGIDLTATKDGVTFGVQCKHWKTWRVGVEQVRTFLGALQDHKLANGFLVTLEGYTPDAADFARRNKIDLLDEVTLLKDLEAVNWRYDPAFAALLNDPRKFCPKCDAEMVLRTATRGAWAGKPFWGCSTYPRCRETIDAA